jgi:hypothetical protein
MVAEIGALAKAWVRAAMTCLAVAWLWPPSSACAEQVEPIAGLKRLYLDTELATRGSPNAVIYHPPGSDWEGAAHQLSATLRARFGFSLPIQCDDSQRKWRAERRNILVLGNDANSPLIRWLQYHSLVVPHSGLKRLIRTVHDPWGEGRNVVVLGGVELASVQGNLSRLLDLLVASPEGSLVLPPLFEPKPAVSRTDRARIEQYRRFDDWWNTWSSSTLPTARS